MTRGVWGTARPPRRSVVTVGAFDGIHLGHRRILNEVVLLATGLGMESVVVTFEPHPAAVLHPGEAPCLLTSLGEKTRLVRQTGINRMVLMRFTPKLASRSAEWFVERVLLARLRMGRLVIGYDFGFGKDRHGDASRLESLGEAHEFGVDIVPPVDYLDHPVSSTRVRTALLRGDVKSAWRMLGRPYSFTGRVVEGEGRGRMLSWPTANLEISDAQKLLASSGVYAVRVRLGWRQAPGALYLGTRPTFGGGKPSIEVHIMGVAGSLYGRQVEIFFVQRIRDDAKFRSREDLKEAIGKDVARAVKILST